MITAVIDTNVLVSGLLAPRGAPGRIRVAAEQGLFIWCLSPELFDEYRDVLKRPRIQKAFKSRRQDTDQFLVHLAKTARWTTDELDTVSIVEADPDDDVVLATALATEAQVIVSGDRHLLEIGEYEGIPVLTPAQFAVQLESEE